MVRYGLVVILLLGGTTEFVFLVLLVGWKEVQTDSSYGGYLLILLQSFMKRSSPGSLHNEWYSR